MGFIFSNDPASAHGLERLDGSRLGPQSSEPPWTWRHDAHARFSQAGQDSGWRVLFEGYLAGPDSTLDECGQPRRSKHCPATVVSDLLNTRGPAGLTQLEGSFALAAWNPMTDQVLATRDRCGGRTLYYNRSAGHVTFSTHSSWLVTSDAASSEEDIETVIAFLALQKAPPPGHSAFKDIAELLPGELLIVDSGRRRHKRPSLDLAGEQPFQSPAEAAEQFLSLFEAAVRACLPSTGPVACMLSGGLDSGPAAVLADQWLKLTNRSLTAVSWSLAGYPDCDERQWIEQTGSQLQQPPHLVDSSDHLPFGQLNDAAINPDLPTYNAFRYQIDDCYQRASQTGCTVILNGAVGDRIYAPRHLLNLDRSKRSQWQQIGQDLVRDLREGGLRGLRQDAAYRYPLGQWLRPWPVRHRPPAWLTAAGCALFSSPPNWPPELDALPFPDYGRALFGTPMAFGVAHELGSAQRHGLDRRDPFQNEALLKFMLRVPMDLSWRGGASKSIMRRAMRGRLPDPIRYKPRTGLLNRFFRAGIEGNATTIRRLLFDEQTDWQRYVDRTSIDGIIEDRSNAPPALLSAVIGHALWRRHWHG